MSATPPSDSATSNKLRSFDATALTDAHRQLLSRTHGSDGGEREWEVFCECGEEKCYEQVFLTLDAFFLVREHGGAVLAPGHRMSQIERARELRLEADALRRQADHQLRRAKRNLRDAGRSQGPDNASP